MRAIAPSFAPAAIGALACLAVYSDAMRQPENAMKPAMRVLNILKNASTTRPMYAPEEAGELAFPAAAPVAILRSLNAIPTRSAAATQRSAT